MPARLWPLLRPGVNASQKLAVNATLLRLDMELPKPLRQDLGRRSQGRILPLHLCRHEARAGDPELRLQRDPGRPCKKYVAFSQGVASPRRPRVSVSRRCKVSFESFACFKIWDYFLDCFQGSPKGRKSLSARGMPVCCDASVAWPSSERVGWVG